MNEGRARFPIVAATFCLVPSLVLLVAAAAPARDCNGNGNEDTLDIDRGSSPDCDTNGVPDECDVGPGNLLFSEPVDMVLEGHAFVPRVVLLDELTGDGLPDLLLFEPRNLLFLRGNGGGTFLEPVGIDIGPLVVFAAVAADTNGDGLRDVAAVVRRLSSGQGGLLVLEGKGGGGFAVPFVVFQGGTDLTGIAMSDLDGDGAVDIAAANAVADYAGVWWNDGSGAFTPDTQLALAWQATTAAAGDLDVDGDADILMAHFGSGIASVHWNEGERRFAGPESIQAGNGGGALLLVDVDRDGDLDLVSSGEDRQTVSVTLHRGVRDYSDPVTYDIGGMARRVLAADADGDGSMDLVALRFAFECGTPVPSLSVLLNRGDGSFIGRKDWGLPLDPSSLALGDVDADGLLDAVVPRVASGDMPRVIVSSFLGRRGSSDADRDGVPDSCILDGRDCNWNGVPDARDIALGTSRDCDGNGVPDGCQPDCDRNGNADACDIAGGAADANSNGLLDACESEAAVDCNGNHSLDSIDVASGASRDCNVNRVPDECEVAPAFRFLAGRAVKLGLGGIPGGAATADLDRDGDLDFAVAMRGSCCAPAARAGSVAIFENLGEGRFAAAGNHAADGDAVLVTAVDLEEDGDADLVVANAELPCKGPAWAAFLVNDGRGGLSRREGFVLPSSPAAVVAGDLDRDGDLDLAFANADPLAAAASIFLNDGTGAFTFAGAAGPSGGATSITAGDWNGDGLLDLAAASGVLRVLLNAGGAVFMPSPASISEEVQAVTGADLDRDGDVDIIAGRASPPLSSLPQVVLLGNEGGVFSVIEEHSIGVELRSLVAGDWNGDGSADVVVAGAASSPITGGVPGGVSVLLGKGDGTLREAGFFTVDSVPHAGAAGDMNGDGTLDLLLTDEIFAAATIYLNEGDGRLAAPLQYTVGAGPRVVVALDANGDGDQDLAVLSELDVPAVTLLRNEGKGAGFLPATFREGVPRVPRAMAAGDLDGDGDPDLAIAGEFTVAILRNDGGAFVKVPALPVGSNPFSVVASDLDRDGDLDLATSNVLGSGFRDNVTVFRNQGLGAFAPGRNFAVGFVPASLVASDLDGDGFDDLIASNAGSQTFSVLRNLAGEGFAPAAEVLTLPPASQVRSGDVDGDGDPDILVSSRDQLALHANLGPEGFLRGRLVGVSSHLEFELADLDRDADPDLLLSTPGQVHILGNRGDGSFDGGLAVVHIGSTLHVPVPPGAGQGGSGDPGPPGASSIAASDLDGDADLDLALSFFAEGKVLILSNVTERAQPDANRNLVPDGCESPSGAVFRRGDAKEDGAIDMTDAVFVLRHLFVTGAPLPCRKAADANDDARVDVSDAVAILRFLFLGDDAPPAPFPGCGEDPTPDLVDCVEYSACP